MDRLYLIVRADLSPAQQAVQAAHALRAFVAAHPELDRAWYEGSNTLALLSVPDEPALAALLDTAGRAGLRFAFFQEPDIGDALTAAAFEPRARKLCRALPLALAR